MKYEFKLHLLTAKLKFQITYKYCLFEFMFYLLSIDQYIEKNSQQKTPRNRQHNFICKETNFQTFKKDFPTECYNFQGEKRYIIILKST